MKREKMLSTAPLAVALAAAFLFFAFQAAWRTPVSAAPVQESVSSGLPEFPFYGEVTVESLEEQFQTPENLVVVVKQDGSPRKNGKIVTGDIIKIVNSKGVTVESFSAIVITGESSAAPSDPVSSNPAEPGRPPVSSMPAEPSRPPVSSIPAESETSSRPDGENGFFDGNKGGYYLFEGPVTVEELAAEISTQPHGLRLKVNAPSGKGRTSGGVCTGDTVATLDGDGTLKSRVTAVIPGDLTGDGSVTETGLDLLRDCLLNRDTLGGIENRAADMNRDGRVDTSDLLLMEKNRPEQ